MIDEYYTWIIFGYHVDELYCGSHKHVVAVCDECCIYRSIRISGYRDLCGSCARKSCTPPPPWSEEMRHAVSVRMSGKKKPPRTDEWKRNQSITMTGRTATEESRQHISAGVQGIPYEEWAGFSSFGGYCEKFDEACRERIRDKYDRKCFVCDIDENENVDKNDKRRKLSVHHVGMNKDQGCNGVMWKLVPLCIRCHPSSHIDPMKSRIEYILANEE